jgi:hypothetical protein
MDASTNTYLISQSCHIDGAPPHVFEQFSHQKPYEYAKLAGNDPVGVAMMGRYQTAPVGLDDGDMGIPRMTADRRMMVDATVTATVVGGFTHKAYWEGTASNIEQTISFGFLAQEIMILNDGSKTINYELGAPCAPATNTMYGGEAVVDNFQSANIHVITYGGGETSAMRVWARG